MIKSNIASMITEMKKLAVLILIKLMVRGKIDNKKLQDDNR